MNKMCGVVFFILMVISLIDVSRSQDDFDSFGEDDISAVLTQPQVPNQQQQQQQPVVDPSGSTTTAASPVYSSCISRCQTVSNYNPVCGSDGVTYPNVYRLNCARNCGRQVTMSRGGTCAGL